MRTNARNRYLIAPLMATGLFLYFASRATTLEWVRLGPTDTAPVSTLVIAPSFTKQSIKLAHLYKARTNWDIALIHADALKYLAEQWNAMEPDKPFPINLLNRTEVIDRERVEFLISLA